MNRKIDWSTEPDWQNYHPKFYRQIVSPCNWWCNQCSVEVYGLRCNHCGKTEEDAK